MNESHTETPPQQSNRRRDIQGIRGIAVAIVVMYHSGLAFSGGFVGVDVFFVVSGYVITLMLLRELEATGSIDLGRFYRRRARRLLPALGLMLAVIALMSTAILGPLGQQQQAIDTGIAASLFVANFQLISVPGGYFDGPAEANPFLHTWSLSVEEQFYLFLPIMLALAWQLAARWRRGDARRPVAGIAISAVVVMSFFVSYSWSAGPGVESPQAQQAFYSSITRVWEFGVGVLLAIGARRFTWLPRAASNVLGTAGIVMIAMASFTISNSTRFPGLAAVMPVAATAMLIVAGAGSSHPWITRALSWKPAVWVGDLSYSWYLWHWPFIVFARTLWPTSRIAAPLAAATALIPAVLAFRHVEEPIRRGQRFPNAKGFKTAAVAMGVSFAALAILGITGRAIRDLPAVAELSDASRLHAGDTSTCDVAGSDTGLGCAVVTGETRQSVYLLGDSNAAQFSEALAVAATEAGFDLTLAVNRGCAPIPLDMLHRGYPKRQCSEFPARELEVIINEEPELVVLAAASDIYIGQERWQIIDPETQEVVGDPERKARLWQHGLESVLHDLDEAGIAVQVINPIPHFLTTDDVIRVDNCPALRLIRDITTCGATASRDLLAQQRHRAMQAELAAIDTAPSASAVDFFSLLCPDTTCAMYSDDRWLYRDGTHLSVDGSLRLTDNFYALITATVWP